MTRLHAVGDNDKRDPGRPAAEEFDPWDTTTHSYSVTDFYTRSTNKFDHSRDVRAAVPTPIHGQMMEMVENKKFPAYRSLADFVRDSIVHRLRTIHGWINDPSLLAILTTEERRCKDELAEAEVDEIEDLLHKYEHGLERHLKNQDLRRLSGKIDDLEDWAFFLQYPHRQLAEALAAKFRSQARLIADAETE